MDNAKEHPPRAEGTVRICLWVASLACCGVVALTVLWHVCDVYAMDDAYMFVRYAHNLLAEGRLAWNPGGEPTYGLTSPLYLSVVVPIHVLARGNPALTAVASSLLCGVAFVVLLVVLVWKHADAGPLGRRFGVLLVLLALAVAVYHTVTHFASGMDTMFAMACLTAYILTAKWHEKGPTVRSAVLMGVCGGLGYFVRPGLMLYSALVPLAILVFGPDARARGHALVAGAVSALVLGAQMGFAHLYFGTALPLPFYAKGLTLYGDQIRRAYRLIPIAQLVQYVAYFWLLFLLIAVDLIIRRRGEKRSPVERGLFLATCLFILYYLAFALQIMYMGARFYYPTLPAIAFLAVQSAARLVRRALPDAKDRLRRLPGPVCWLATLCFLYALSPLAKLSLDRVRVTSDIGRFDVAAEYASTKRGFWFALDRFSHLPDDLVIATTEIGYPGAMNPHKQIIDMTGLNETAFGRQGFSAERLFAKYKPDLIYMPHQHYQEMIADIRAHPYFREHYEYYPAQDIAAHLGITKVDDTMGIALHRRSKHFPALLAIMPAHPATPKEE